MNYDNVSRERLIKRILELQDQRESAREAMQHWATIAGETKQQLAIANAVIESGAASTQELQQDWLKMEQQLAEAKALLERYQKLITHDRDDWRDSAVIYAINDAEATTRLYQDIRAFLQKQSG